MEEREDATGSYSRAEYYEQIYADRSDAGQYLANELRRFTPESPLVLAVGLSAVPVAFEVALELRTDFDVIAARKIGAPSQRALAIGAVTADGSVALAPELVSALEVPQEYIARVAAEQHREAARQEACLRAAAPALDVSGRVVILVEAGLATGVTARACLSSLKRGSPDRTIVAAPVASEQACQALQSEADVVVCACRARPFYAVGAHYRSFQEVTVQQAAQLLGAYQTIQGASREA